MEKCALLFHFEEQRAQKLKKALSRLEIAVKQVKPEEYGLPLGLLAGLPGSFLFAARGAAGSPQPAGAAGQKEALDAMRRAGVSGIALKAMLTETNRFWNARQLVWELKREHESFHRP